VNEIEQIALRAARAAGRIHLHWLNRTTTSNSFATKETPLSCRELLVNHNTYGAPILFRVLIGLVR